MIRAVLFDMDGVLLESKEAWFQVLNAAALRFGYPPISRERFEPTWGQGVDKDVEIFFPSVGETALEEYYFHHFRDQSKHMSVHPRAAEILDSLPPQGIRTAVITNTPSRLAGVILQSAMLHPELLVGAGDVPKPKPAPDMVLHACGGLGVRPAEAVVVGDSRFDRGAAESAGVRFVGIGIEGLFTLRDVGELPGLLPRL